jgi:hypothetical protein
VLDGGAAAIQHAFSPILPQGLAPHPTKVESGVVLPLERGHQRAGLGIANLRVGPLRQPWLGASKGERRLATTPQVGPPG